MSVEREPSRLTEAYNSVPYPGFAHQQTHPDRLATMATLFGMTPRNVESCTVLEIGCADGSNLIPMAHDLPGTSFVGIDLSTSAVERARDLAGRVGLTNVRFEICDLRDVAGIGVPFDYIIAHGIYSWIPASARDALLGLCNALLTPSGVAFVSYNAYPGSHFRDLVRNLMLFHAGETEDPGARVEQARGVLQFVAQSKTEPDLYRQVLSKELERIAAAVPGAIFHDDLEEVNHPVYFRDFVAQAERHGLQFLSEADLFEMELQGFADGVVETVERLSAGNLIAREQYLDFLRCRRFRQTLLCRESVTLDRSAPERQVQRLSARSALRPEIGDPDVTGATEVSFSSPKGTTITTGHPIAKAALLVLHDAWPSAIAFAELLEAAVRRAGRERASEVEVRALASTLIQMNRSSLAQLHVRAPRIPDRVDARPTASRLVRVQLEAGPRVTSAFHEIVDLAEPRLRGLVELLDGTQTVPELASRLEVDVADVAQNLENLRRLGLLLSQD